MANTIEYAKLFQKELDQAAVQTLTTGWMEANAGQVIYNGGDEVKVPKLSLDGLADYKRDTGYSDGAITLEYETMKLTQDRGRKFSIDAMDVDESGFVATAAAVLGTFQREKVVPEIDAYRIAELYEAAKAANQATDYAAPSVNDIVAKFKADITTVRKRGGQNLVAHISYDALGILETALATQLHTEKWTQGEVDTTVKVFDGVPLIPTADDRMGAEVTINAEGGYTKKGALNWVIVDSRVPIAISKTDVPRIFTPDQNQSADAYIVTYRKYHDLWVLDNKKVLVAASVKEQPEG